MDAGSRRLSAHTANFYFIPLVWYSLKLNFSNLGHHNFFAAAKLAKSAT